MYRRRASPLHAAGAAAGIAYCGALAVVALASDSPVLLAATLVAVLGAAGAAGVGREVGRAAVLALPLVILIAIVNPLLAREGLTVIARLGEVPVFGQLDITLEAAVYGAVLGLRALVVILACALYAVAVDPDQVLRLMRRVSFRSALTATLATRMVPILARDARRMADAQRCRPGARASRSALVRAVATGALDRSIDVAATLELRGYGAARRPPREPPPRSRHQIAFMAAAGALLALLIAGAVAGVGTFTAYPSVRIAVGGPELVLAVAIVLCALAPFADRRGIGR